MATSPTGTRESPTKALWSVARWTLPRSRETWVIMAHNTKTGGSRLLDQCSLPLTGKRCVTRVYTDIAVVLVDPEGFVVTGILDGISRDELCDRTAAPLRFAKDCAHFTPPAHI